jgi:hypothetical protein
MLLLFALSKSFAWAAEGLIAKVPDPSGSICHLKFPAITEKYAIFGSPGAQGSK